MTEHTHNSNHRNDRIIMCYEVPSSDTTVDKCVNQNVMHVHLAQCDMSSIFQEKKCYKRVGGRFQKS